VDIEQVAQALKVTREDVTEYFTDGRRVSFLIERRMAREVLEKSARPDSEGAPYDVTDRLGGKWEVRSITRGGVYFCPSNQVGKGRAFDHRGFEEKLTAVTGYVLADVEAFPRAPFWLIPVDTVRDWWTTGKLQANTKVRRKRILELIREYWQPRQQDGSIARDARGRAELRSSLPSPLL